MFLCVDPPFAQKLYREHYFRTCTLGATETRVGDGSVKKMFFKISLFEQQIAVHKIFSRGWENISSRLKNINSVAQGNQKLARGWAYVLPLACS